MKDERSQADLKKLRLSPATIRDFKKLSVMVKTFYDEISLLSKKSPDSPLNNFKVKFLNEILVKVTTILGSDYRPFPDFESFSDPDLPSASDAVLMLSHYIASMELYQHFHTYQDAIFGKCWYTNGDETIEV